MTGKFVSKSEEINKSVVRKSIHTSKKISKDEKFSLSNICLKRPGNGISADKYLNIIGTKAKKIIKRRFNIILI